jgi:Flp pilus assembly protein TadB
MTLCKSLSERYTQYLLRRLSQAGVSEVNPREFFLIQWIFLGLSLAPAIWAVYYVQDFSQLRYHLLCGAGLFGLVIPLLWLSQKTRERLARVQATLPKVIDLLLSAVRSGDAQLQSWLQPVSVAGLPSVSLDIQQFLSDIRAGHSHADALSASALRLPLRHYECVLQALVTAAANKTSPETDLTECLRLVERSLRGRQLLRVAKVLGCLLWIVAIVVLLNYRSLAARLLPNSTPVSASGQ